MSKLRFAGKLASGAAVLLLCALPAIAQSGPSAVSVRSVASAPVDVKPRSSATLVFQVRNESARELELTGRLRLPEGWKPVMEETPFVLAGNAGTVRFVPIFVPVEAPVGTYEIGYLLGALNDPLVVSEGKAEVRVLLDARMAVQAMDTPPFAIAGDVCTSRFRVVNQGNASLDVGLTVKSNGYDVSLETERVRVEAGRSRTVDVSVRTDPGLRGKLIQQVELVAAAGLPDGRSLGASALTQQEIIPRVYGRIDDYNKLPTEVGFVALAGGGSANVQFKIAGSGALDASGKRTVDAVFRGPGRTDFNLFGLQREEYRLRYDSPAASFVLGDKVYSLTNLTNFGEYGRGAEARLSFGRWSVRGFSARSLFIIGSPDSDRALQIGYAPREDLSLKFSYLSESRTGRTNSRIFSLQSRFSSPLADITAEYSWDRSDISSLGAASSALWLEAGGSAGIVAYRANVIRSGAEFQGYYRNLDYNSAEFTLTPWKKLQVRASYLDQRRNTAILPYFSPFFDRTLQAGAYYQATSRLSFSLEQRVHNREDLSESIRFKYRDSTLRAGAMVNVGALNVQAYLDYGRTFNELTLDYEKLAEYTLSGQIIIINKFTLGSYIHYRDQNVSFTGDRERQLDLNFNAGFQTGRTRLEAFYRTSLHQELYQTALSEKRFEDPLFLLNNYDMFGLNVTQRFGNGHQLSLRVQKATNAFDDGGAGNRIIGLLEYSIPLGIPISRKTEIGKLRGKVYDAENGSRGVEGVIVRANDLATITNAEGDYVFNGLEPGSYLLMLEKPSDAREKITLERTPVEVAVAGGRSSECSIGLVTGASIFGRVTIYRIEKNDAGLIIQKAPAPNGPTPAESVDKPKADEAKPKMIERGALIASTVELIGPDDVVLHAVTDEDGRFAFEGLRPGKYTLRALGDALPELHVFEQDSIELELTPGSRLEVEFKVVPLVRPVQLLESGEVTVVKKDAVVKKDPIK